MSDHVIDMFRSPFLHLKVKDWGNKKKLLIDLMSSLEFNYWFSVKTTFEEYICDSNKLNNDTLNQEIKKIFSDELQIFSESFEIYDYEVIQSWFQIEEKGMFHPIHNHGYGISSVCYIDYDSNVHKPLALLSPSNNLIHSETEIFMPKNISEGSIVFFPSIVNHFTFPNQTDVLRKIVAFNIKVD